MIGYKPIKFGENSVMYLIVVLYLFVTYELSIHEAKADEFLTIVNAGLEDSRSFSGNQGFDIYVETENPGKVLFVEQWESETHLQKYFQWRLDRGDFDILNSFYSSPPVVHKYFRTTGE